jgi:hypothetical protein
MGLHPGTYHRKHWEFVYIARAIDTAGLDGASGIGFGVGREPLPAVLAGLGAQVLATDLPNGESSPWAASGQWAGAHGWPKCVAYAPVDMRAIPAALRDGSYDFVWSACALDHLGTLQAGLDFIFASLECLKSGGIAVHTTEYNLSDHVRTLETGGTVLYRQSDLQGLMREVVRRGDRMYLDLTPGFDPWDTYVPKVPEREPHLCMELGGFITTSVGIVIQRGSNGHGD